MLFHPLVIAAGVVVTLICLIALHDIFQRRSALKHNFPVIGWIRYLFESQRTKIRQYFVAGPRDERPYNLRQREYVYRSAKKLPSSTGFGSDAELDVPGAWAFMNSAFPTQESEAPDDSAKPPVIGPHRREPFQPKSFVNIADMSYGSLGQNAVQALSRGASLSGVWLGSGEGSMTPHHKAFPCDRVLEIGSGLFGVRELDGTFSKERFHKLLPDIKAITIKLSQGAKPGSGGVLPAAKITAEIARIRNIPRGVDCHSPNRFKEFHDVPSMLDWIRMLQDESGKPVGIKFCLGDKRFVTELIDALRGTPDGTGPDFIMLDGSEGGTGAAPPSLADNMGTPIRQALPWLDNQLRAAGLRERIRIIAAGRFAIASEVAFGLAMGADFINIARGFLMAMGCIQAQECHTNKCPTGITTHSKWLQAGLDPTDKGNRVANYALRLRADLMTVVRSVGLLSPAELNRHHVFINDDDRVARSLAEIFPYPTGKDPVVLPPVAHRGLAKGSTPVLPATDDAPRAHP